MESVLENLKDGLKKNIKPKNPLKTKLMGGTINPNCPKAHPTPNSSVYTTHPMPPAHTTQHTKVHHSTVKRLINIIIKGILTIVVVFVLFVAYKSYTSYNSTMAKANEIAGNWPEYRCQPSVMPFASQLTGGKVNTISNGIDCLITAYIKPYITAFITPFIQFFEKILDVIVDLVNSVQNIRKMFNYLRESIHTFLLDIANMFYAYAKKISYMVNRMMDTFNKIFLVFEDMFYALGYAIYTVASLWNSPVGGVARFFCLHKNTLITMKDGSEKPIGKIKVGDKIKKGGRVLAVHLFSGKRVQMYLYKNKIIAGFWHLIREDGKWIRMENSKHAVPLDEKEDEIYCLTTSKSKIVVDGNLFADYMELETPIQMTTVLNIVMEYLNNKPSKISGKSEKVWGFAKDTLIKTKLGLKKIKNLRLGEKLGDGNTIEGITKIYGRNVKLYNHNGTICSGNIIVKKGGEWKLMKDIEKPLKNKRSVLYHIFTTKGELCINKEIYRDYEQVEDDDVNDQIDEYVESKLNTKN